MSPTTISPHNNFCAMNQARDFGFDTKCLPLGQKL